MLAWLRRWPGNKRRLKGADLLYIGKVRYAIELLLFMESYIDMVNTIGAHARFDKIHTSFFLVYH